MLILLVGFIFALELLMYVPLVWRYKRVVVIVLVLFNLGLLLVIATKSTWWLPTILFNFISIFRFINFARIYKNRTQPEYLYASTFKTSIILIVCSSAVLALLTVGGDVSSKSTLLWLGGVQVFCSLVLFLITTVNIMKLQKNLPIANYADRELPTVSVCIPARNETQELESCISSLLASTYPKLEIIVLDDCSTDTTPNIIKNFAHDGVRFIKGTHPETSWLPKNQACQQLADEASGQFLLFCGVDTKFAPLTITKMVEILLSSNKKMLSILPYRLTNNSWAALIQPMRYWWELALPRWFINSPPVLSTCWLIEAATLKKHGSFAAVKHSILPERYFAKKCNQNRQYIFLKANELIDVQTTKQLQNQKQTMIRVRYPQVHRRPELVMVLVLFEIVVLLLPYFFLLLSLLLHSTPLFIVSLMSIFLNLATHISIVTVTNPANIPISVVNYPIVILTDLFLGFESMIRYEFMTVEWKNRNICLPVMHVYPSLPKIH